MKLPILKIAELTGVHRDTISKRLADLPFEASKKGAKLYSSEHALAAIYKTDSLEAAHCTYFAKMEFSASLRPSSGNPPGR